MIRDGCPERGGLAPGITEAKSGDGPDCVLHLLGPRAFKLSRRVLVTRTTEEIMKVIGFACVVSAAVTGVVTELGCLEFIQRMSEARDHNNGQVPKRARRARSRAR
jgi:hypothetical protein